MEKISNIEIIYQFNNKEWGTTNGLYKIEFKSGSTYYILRNNESFGAIQHYLDRPSTECVSIIRDDIKKEIRQKLNN